MATDTGRDEIHRRLEARRQRLRESRALGPLAAVAARFKEIDGANQGVLVSVQLFTVIIPLMILGFGYFSGFAENASAGTIWIRELGLDGPARDTVRDAFGSTADLRSVWTALGIAAFLAWGIPMSMTVAAMFAKAWRREQFGPAQRIARGAAWFLLYLAMLVARERIAYGADHSGLTQAALFAAALVPVWIFWSLTPAVLVRDGGRGFRYLALAGLAGVVIDGIIIPVGGRLLYPPVIEAWTDFGAIGIAMALVTWCLIVGIGWVITACVGAVLWERVAPTDTVVDAQTGEPRDLVGS